MSHAALAAVLRLDGVGPGERLAAFSLASFANREHRAWPGTPVAAARAGLSRTQYLAARERLAGRGLVRIEEPGSGRGRSPVVWLRFAEIGPWADVEVNPGLTEAVLTHSRARGAARLLLATLATIADESGEIAAVSTGEFQAAAGMADSTYRRARAVLLASGELVLATAGGGRARTNRWTIPNPRAINPEPIAAARRRAAPTPGARPLLMTARPPQPATEVQLSPPTAASNPTADEREEAGSSVAAAASGPGQNRTVSTVKGSRMSGVCAPNPAQNRTVSGDKRPRSGGVCERNPGQDRTACRETPPQTPPETPSPNARAGREPQNPGITKRPPNPPAGGPGTAISLVEDYVTPRGRRRQRTVPVDLEQAAARFLSPSHADHAVWQRIRSDLESHLGNGLFSIWLSPLELVGCTDDTLLLACPAETRAWVSGRYRALLERIGNSHGRPARLASDPELQLLDALHAGPAPRRLDAPLPHHRQEAI